MDKIHNRIRFGVFEVRPASGELLKHGIRMKLEQQPFSVLLALLEQPGAAVTRSELRARIWPEGTFVDFDKSLTKAVNKVRGVLGDSAATPRFVETLARKGYRFIAPVTFDDQPLSATSTPPALPGRPWWLGWAAGAALTLVFTLSLLIAWRAIAVRPRAPTAAPPIQSLAVLPFVNLTGDPAQEYLVDGLTDDLISNLSRIGTVRVISYTSAMHYKGARKSLPELARELSVDSAIEGSLQRVGAVVRLNVKLIRAAADRQLWSESYEVDAADSARLEGRVTLAVANQITAHLTADAASRMTGAGFANPRAYDAYLRGRYLWNLRGRESITQAAFYFEQAVGEDPNFALAWSGLADTYTIGWEARSDPMLAEDYARKALALDPALAEAHVSLGFALVCQRRFAGGEKELKRGAELNPNYVAAHQLSATYLLVMGRLDEALAESDRALQLDPFSLPVNNMRALILIGMHRLEEAEEHERIAAQLSPLQATPLQNLARIYLLQHKVSEAVAAEAKAAALVSGSASAAYAGGLANVETAFSRSGFRAGCFRLVQLREETGFSTSTLSTYLIYGLLQDKQKVLEWASSQIGKKGYAGIYHFNSAPELDFIRSDPRFQDLLRRIGIR